MEKKCFCQPHHQFHLDLDIVNFNEKKVWKLYVNRFTTKERSDIELILVNPKIIKMQHALKFKFWATNNKTKYEALIVGLKIATYLEIEKLMVYSDSWLVVCQVGGEYEVKEETMVKYLIR